MKFNQLVFSHFAALYEVSSARIAANAEAHRNGVARIIDDLRSAKIFLLNQGFTWVTEHLRGPDEAPIKKSIYSVEGSACQV